jgi:hypothetical protein
MASLNKYLYKVISTAEKKAATLYTQKLRNYALNYGWPSDLANSLNIEYNNGYNQITCAPGKKDAIQTLEYGTESIPLSPALRSFMIEENK